MKYHSKTLALIGGDVPSGSLQQVEECEQKLGIALPPSVREWYVDVDGTELFSKYSNKDRVFRLRDFEIQQVEELDILVFMSENQGVCWWGVELDGSEDPAVFVMFDSYPDCEDFMLHSHSFSEFTYIRVFDFEGLGDEHRYSVDICRPLRTSDIDYLRSTFVEEPISYGFPSGINLRYLTKYGRVIIGSSEHQADWTLVSSSSSDYEMLDDAVRHLWRVDP